MTSDEISVITRYRLMSDDCKGCINLLLNAAMTYQANGATVIEMIATASKMR